MTVRVLPMVIILIALIALTSATDEKPWILQQHNVCFGAKDDKFGKFYLNRDGAIYALKLVHKSGYVSCSQSYKSNWGCDVKTDVYYHYKYVGVVITDALNAIVFPKGVNYTHGFYKLVGYHALSKSIAFTDLSTPMYASDDQELRIWYREDLMNYTEGDNGGVACADVYAKFM